VLLLGIESSCDETSVALCREGNLLSNVVHTQIPLHRRFGGVVPELASRNHLTAILPVLDEALQRAGVTLPEVEALGVTHAPGLIGSLLVGLSTAKALAFFLCRPLVGVHHLEAHLLSPLIEHPELQPPYLALLVSGGHTLLVEVTAVGDYLVLGRTVDDAVGEAFDKVAVVLGLPYPGGREIETLAGRGNPEAMAFPRAKMGPGDLDFSFSGLKTAVVLYCRRNPDFRDKAADLAASFQEAAVETLLAKTERALEKRNLPALCLCGGVAANTCLRERAAAMSARRGLLFAVPSPALCGDNAGMIAFTAWQALKAGRPSPLGLAAAASLPLPTRPC